ncbi:sugar phosphate isomerase/epimerase [Dactylosporangium sp. NBC_01737]|uniref:sugar phosphate isomerase/epimerase family protein n=1 Tax=Dactylosporangium sp. NBC_01737 TaxID=2975959 RepID=UPI002E0E923C|nr:sugar phosphate isomerase/epimerase [Dactylosporangium sp. NBC_01737]
MRQLDATGVLEVAAAAGLACVEWGADRHVPPGDPRTAADVRRRGLDLGVAVASYGSYFRAGPDDPADFGAVLAAAVALGAPRIRIWAGVTGSAGATADQRGSVVAGARSAVARAADAGVQVAFEFHGGTLTDAVPSTLDLLDESGAATYWQPPVGMPDDLALAGLAQILDRVAAVHAFSWWPRQERRPLLAREALWRGAFSLLRSHDIDCLLEFVPGDDPAAVAGEAAALRRLAAA